MKINSLKVQNYRNIENIEIIPSDGVNIIYGNNAQGKTNLLEAMWLFTGCRSFRGSKEKELIRFGCDFSKTEMNFFDEMRNRTAVITIDEKKHLELDGVNFSSCSELFGEFFGIIFTPDHLNLVKGGPAERRKFINTALCQLKPKYSNVLGKYNKILEQRNTLLKDISYHSELTEILDIWDEKFSFYSAVIISQRLRYLDEIKPFLENIYEGISSGKEKISLEYDSPFSYEEKDTEKLREKILYELKKCRDEDIRNGITSLGPHKDDILIKLDGISAKAFASQGQKRSCALSLKLSEAAVMKKITGRQPIAFLDDVMSELDDSRQDYLLNHIDDWQVFITCCEPSSILKTKNGKIFEMCGGKICSCT